MSQGQGAREKKVTKVKPSVSEPLNVGRTRLLQGDRLSDCLKKQDVSLASLKGGLEIQ